MAAGWCPILVQFQANGSGADLFRQTGRLGGVALAGETKIQRQVVHRLQHHLQVEGTGRAGGGTGATPDRYRRPPW